MTRNLKVAALLSSVFVCASSCTPRPRLVGEDRLEAVYSAAGHIVGKNTNSMFDQAIQQGGYQLVRNLGGSVSAARFNSLTYIAWRIEARDATGGSQQDKIKVIATLGRAAPSSASAKTLIDGGGNGHPTLAVLGNRLYCMWLCGGQVCLSWTSDGSTWSNPITGATPTGQRIEGIDLTEHNGRLHTAGVTRDGAAWRLFAAQVHIGSTGNVFAFTNVNSDVVPGDNPSESEGVSLASDGTRLSLGYVRGTTSKITDRDNSAWSLSSSLIHDFQTQPGSRPALAYVNNHLYACYRNGSVLTVRMRPAGSTNWGAANFTVNDAQAAASAGIDCHKITVFRNP